MFSANNKSKMEAATLKSIEELADLYCKNKKTIRGFYQLNQTLGPIELRKKAITGSTFRAFHIDKAKGSYGMCFYFNKSIEKFIKKNPIVQHVQQEFISELKANTKGRFNNWNPDDNGLPKLMKLYHLYANYWVAYNLIEDYDHKLSSIRKLNVPLDKYSLTFIGELYNASTNSIDNQPRFSEYCLVSVVSNKITK